MKRLTMILFVIALIIVAFETFRPQPRFPYSADAASNTAVAVATVATTSVR